MPASWPERRSWEVAKGRDPVLEERMRREAETVEDFAQVYLDRYAKIAKAELEGGPSAAQPRRASNHRTSAGC